MQTTLLVLAAGIGSRYGGLKQIDPVGPNGELIIDYSIHDAIRAGFGKVVFVIRKDIEDEFMQRLHQFIRLNAIDEFLLGQHPFDAVIDHHVRHFFRVGRDHTLPTDGTQALEGHRVHHHLHRQPVGAKTHHRTDRGNGQVSPVFSEKGSYIQWFIPQAVCMVNVSTISGIANLTACHV